MSLFTLADPEIFMGCEEKLNAHGKLYLTAWKMHKKDVSNPNMQSFGEPLFTVGNQLGGEKHTDYVGLKIFNGVVKGDDLDKLCEDLMHTRLRPNLDGYSYHAANIQCQTGDQEEVTKFLRLNDMFDWREYTEGVPSGTNFKPGPCHTTWTRRSQANPRTIVVEKKDSEELRAKQNELDALQSRFDKDSEELRAELKSKQSDLDIFQRKFDDLQRKLDNLQLRYDNYDSDIRLSGNLLPPTIFVRKSSLTQQYVWSDDYFPLRDMIPVLDEPPANPGSIAVAYPADFDSNGWRVVVVQSKSRRHKFNFAVYEGNRAVDTQGTPFPSTVGSPKFSGCYGPMFLENCGRRFVVCLTYYC